MRNSAHTKFHSLSARERASRAFDSSYYLSVAIKFIRRGSSRLDQIFKKLEGDHNTVISKTAGRKLLKMLYGYFSRFQGGQSLFSTMNSEIYKFPEELRQEVRVNIEKEQKKAIYQYNQNRFQMLGIT